MAGSSLAVSSMERGLRLLCRARLPVLAATWLCAICALSAFGACANDTIGVDPSLANGSVGALLGEAPGQTFTVQDILVELLKV
jgi:hypothetical protein